MDSLDGPSVVDRIARALAGDYLRKFILRLRKDVLRTFHLASARAVACLVAAALFITAVVLLVNAGLLGLVAIHVPPPVAYLGIGLLALGGGWLVIRAAWAKPDPEDPE
ncbi:MAG TPA: hypothetical protein VKU80_07990 [Planctomycetota bacterium]|nr:hypothetical protein [Planctomycetota bacterium]